MKHFKLLLLFIVIATTAFTQIKQGQFLIGGNISFESLKTGGSNAADYKATNFSISPIIGYFIIEKLAGGIRLDFHSYRQTTPNDWHQTYTSVSPFLRYYFLPSAKKVNAFIDVSYLNYRSKFKNGTSYSHIERSNGYSISAGPAIFLTEQVALEFTIGYKRIVENYGHNFSSTINNGIGLQIHLGRKKAKTKK